MPLPPEVDNRIRERFEQLMAEAERLHTVDFKKRSSRHYSLDELLAMGVDESDFINDPFKRDFYTLQTNTLSLLQVLTTKTNHVAKLAETVRKLTPTDIEQMFGIIRGLKSDYESGMLETLAHAVEASVTGDYITQAEQLLKEGKQGNYDHVPAAVLTGAILEDGLRRLCQRQSPPIQIKTGKYHKKMNTMIDDLRKIDLFNELKAKQLRAWVGVRNAAAHGQFDEFNRSDVEQMLTGVQQFLTDYL